MKSPKQITGIMFLSLLVAQPGFPADLSPAHWPPAEKARAEEAQKSLSPAQARTVEGPSGLVAATTSPIAVQAGIQALRQGGTAADAAATVALTQVTTALGSYVSAAGILQLVYYDAASGKVISMNAGFNSWLGETEPATIPGNGSEVSDASGRKTLVPGFMAGIEAMQKRYGRLAFADVFQAAIWYAENGVAISPLLDSFFGMRGQVLSRTAEGRQFLHQAGDHPWIGDRFVQTELAKTLRGVANDGAAYMYTGPWGQQFVDAVRRESGKATMDDMKRYQPIWEEPLSTTFLGDGVFGPGVSNEGGYLVLEALNLVEERKTQEMGPYWKDWRAFRDLSEILQIAEARTRRRASHSDAIVVIDRWGNVAALVHSINSVVWGTTGIVVEGVPISDAAGINQYRLAHLKPGDRVPNDMAPIIVMRDAKPVLATAAIGSSLTAETVRLLVGILGNGLDAATVMAAPPLLYNYGSRVPIVPEGAYDTDFLKNLEAAGVKVQQESKGQVATLKGTVVVGAIDPDSAHRRSVETRGVSDFAAAY
jgi:gamma-glutamyltranspeptidase/glutathione hydrolase